VNRARNRLAEILAVDSVEEFGPDSVVQATLDFASSPSSMRMHD
jgi:hypothetical protein